ncbi:MAG: TlpA family protein disulfide reductase [Saprospiraceae bacterium]|nr:TlpA family protein disulfide reductase [Saprospiraceae bacterium]
MKVQSLIFILGLGLLVLACQPKKQIGGSDESNQRLSGEEEFQQYLDRKANAFEGKQAPAFELTDLEGKKYTNASLKGKVVLLNFWFMACAPCITEVASLKKLKEDYAAKGLELIAVSTDPESKLGAFVKEKNINYPVVADGSVWGKKYKVSSYPTTYLIDQKGMIRKVFIGASDWDATYTYMEVRPHLEKILAE